MAEYDYNKQKQKFLDEVREDEEYVVNVLVKYLKNASRKDTLWKMFGKQIYFNLEQNLQGTRQCVKCKERFVVDGSAKKIAKYCPSCSENLKRENEKFRKQKQRKIGKIY